MDARKQKIIDDCETQIYNLVEGWSVAHTTGCLGGKMRELRGSGIEAFVINTINSIGELYKIDLTAVCGDDDKKDLVIVLPGGQGTICKKHQVDVHIYLNHEFIAVIECKAYLDSCYYERACSDFTYFRSFGYNVKKYIFTLENSIGSETKMFIDHTNGGICDNVFCMFDGKRNSVKPLYDSRYKKTINKHSLAEFIQAILTFAGAGAGAGAADDGS